MNNEHQFLNSLKLKILAYDLQTSNDFENYIINFFLNGSVKCMALNEMRNLIDSCIEDLKLRNSYTEDTYNFFSDIRKQIAIFDLQKIYEDDKIDIVKNLEVKEFNNVSNFY